MAEKRNCFTFIWRIKNYSLVFDSIVSPPFFVHEMGGSKWRLELITNNNNFQDIIYCSVWRGVGDYGPDELKIDYELSFVNGNGTVLHSEMHCEKIHKKQHSRRCIETKDKVFLYNKDLLIPDDALTIRCRMWNSEGSISRSGSCFAETRIGGDIQYVVGTIEKFSTIESKKKYPVHQKSSSKEKFLSCLNLCVTADGVLYITFQPFHLNYKSICCRCKIFVLDKLQNKVNFGQGLFRGERLFHISLGLSKEYLMEKKEYFLPNDELTIRCEMNENFISNIGEIFLSCQSISEIEYILNCKDTNRMLSNTRVGDVSSEKYSTENLTTLKDDWISVLRDATLCDTKLKTATETFSAHKVVLSARSPVFKSMFTTDMREKTNNCVEIDDIDADTVRRMLLFTYSDALDDLDYESAKPLYSAADKYNIVSLRQRCSNFLKQNLSASNCCDILVLADRHQDEGLKNAAQYCVSANEEVVLSSEDWKNMEKNNSQLAIEAFRFICMKNRKK